MIFWFHAAFSNISNSPLFYTLWQVNESLEMSCNPLKIVVPIWTYVKEIQQNYFEPNLLVLQQHMQLTYYCNTEGRSRDRCCHGGIKYHEHLSVALAIRYESTCAMLYCHLLPVWLYPVIPHYLINGAIFEKEILNIKYVYRFSLQLSSETFLILWRIRDIIINVHRSICEVRVILVKFWWNLNFLDRFTRNTEISNLIKIRPKRAVLFHADRQTWQSLIFFFFAILRTRRTSDILKVEAPKTSRQFAQECAKADRTTQ